MSRKFLDDNVELLLTTAAGSTNVFAALPKTTDKTYKRGHLAVEEATGLRFTNEGNTTTSSLWLSPRYNALILEEPLTALPHLLANQSASTNTACFIAGTNAVDSTVAFAVDGGVTLTTTTASNDQVILAFNNTNSAWGTVTNITDNGFVFETQIVTSSAVTATTIWAGLKLTNTSVVATDDDQAMFRFAVGTDAFWHFVTSVGNVDTDTASTITVALSTSYLLQIRIGTDRKPHYFVNGIRIGIGPALTASLTTLKPYVGVQTTTTAAKTLRVRGMRLVRPRVPLNT